MQLQNDSAISAAKGKQDPLANLQEMRQRRIVPF